MSQRRADRFRRLMAAEERIAEALTPHGVSDLQLREALDAAEAALPVDEADERDFYRPALALYVAALGGRLETGSSQAVFPQTTVRLDPERSA